MAHGSQSLVKYSSSRQELIIKCLITNTIKKIILFPNRIFRDNLKNRFLFAFFLRLAGQFVSLLMIILISRFLGPERFGKYNLLYGIAGIYAVLLTTGFNHILIRELNRRSSERSVIVGASLSLRLIIAWMGMIGTILTVQLYPDLGPEIGWGVAIGVSLSLLGSFWQPSWRMSYEGILESDQAVHQSAALNFIGKILFILVVGCVFLWGGSLKEVVWGQAFAEILAIIITVILLSQWGYNVLPALNRREIVHQIKESYPLILVEIFSFLIIRFDLLIIGYFKGAIEAGYFSAATRLIDAFNLIPGVLLPSIIPYFVHKKSLNELDYHNGIKVLTRILTLIGITGALFSQSVAQVLISIIYGKDYLYSSVIFSILIWWVPLNFIIALWRITMIVEGKQSFQIAIIGLMGCLNAILNWWFVPIWGGWGASVARVIGSVAILPLIIFISPTLTKIVVLIFKNSLPIILAAGIGGVLIHYLDSISLRLGVALISFFWCFRALGWRRIKDISESIKSFKLPK
ncbi:MAG: flippase [bacterium]